MSVRNRAVPFAEACKRCGFSINKGYQEITAGRLIARKNGRQTVVLETDLEAYLQALPRLDMSENSSRPGCRNTNPPARRKREALADA